MNSVAPTDQTDQTDFDLIICGGGPVGLCVAGLLARRGVAPARIAVIDMKTPQQAAQDPRTLALSHGSRQILEDLGAWAPIAHAATPIEQIHVSRRGHFGRTLLDRSHYQLPALGYVARYGTVCQALQQAMAGSAIQALRPAQVLALEEGEQRVAVALEDGRTFTAHLAVQAEGGVFEQQPETPSRRATRHDYQQLAVITHVKADAAIAGRAFERFTDEGPLALLPQDDGYALVWCMRPARAEHILALDDAAFLLALGQAFGQRVGRFVATGPRHAYALGLNTRPGQGRRVAVIGNAAQTLHPVAGQGLNLGLRDARVLADLLAREQTPAALQHFERQRQPDRALTVGLTDLMARIFASAPQGSLVQTLLGLSLGAVDLLPPARDLLAAQMMYGRR